ncbi:type II toxin-antitoxin system HigB family toxin [Palleronia sp.]|uniref:type II toxin-antitoxin system HigB family toxin n=1 Tax=Palleronia sp. TaxID=1940284 RepID=UPI0035C80F15
MRIVSRKALKEFAKRFPDAEDQLEAWFHETKKARWQTPADIKAKYRSASILKDSRVVFNICGNKYRIVVKISYANGIVLIRFVGTHGEYDEINAEEV